MTTFANDDPYPLAFLEGQTKAATGLRQVGGFGHQTQYTISPIELMTTSDTPFMPSAANIASVPNVPNFPSVPSVPRSPSGRTRPRRPSGDSQPQSMTSSSSAAMSTSSSATPRTPASNSADSSQPPPKKRAQTGRKRMNSKADAAAAAAMDMAVVAKTEPTDGDDNASAALRELDSATRKRSATLERNRVAALKCRQKKKEWIAGLEDQSVELENEHNELQAEYKNLVGEITEIKNQLMDHAACNDPQIDTWIDLEARRFVQTTNERYSREYGAQPGAAAPALSYEQLALSASFSSGLTDLVPGLQRSSTADSLDSPETDEFASRRGSIISATAGIGTLGT